MTAIPVMSWLFRTAVLLSFLVVSARGAAAAPPTLFRIFLIDGTEVVSSGEYTRVGTDVVFSMAVGGSTDDPRVQLVTLPADTVDWMRTERSSEAVRAAHYASTRGDEDFAQLSNEVARVLNDIALSTDRSRALALAERARDVLVKWPKEHYHYREAEVRDILSIVDTSIASLKGQPASPFDLALVASTGPVAVESPPALPQPKDRIAQLMHIADLVPRAVDRVSLLQTALGLVEESAAILPKAEASSLREAITSRVEHEQDVDARYARLSRQLTSEATRAANAAKSADIEHLLAKMSTEDRKLGSERPEMVQALRAALEARLNDARRLRLLRDQWLLRRRGYEEYQRRIGKQIVQLVKARPQLEAIRKLEGPSPDRLLALKRRLQGGAEWLQRQTVPAGMEPVHELLVGAWRFAESAANGRYDAVTTGKISTAWTASSAAAGAMMLLTRAQDELRTELEIPRLK